MGTADSTYRSPQIPPTYLAPGGRKNEDPPKTQLLKASGPVSPEAFETGKIQSGWHVSKWRALQQDHLPVCIGVPEQSRTLPIGRVLALSFGEGSAVSGAFFDENEHFSTFFMRFLEND